MNPIDTDSQHGPQFTLAGMLRLTVLVAIGCSLAAATSHWKVAVILRVMVTLSWPSIVALLYWLLSARFGRIKLLSILTVAILVSSVICKEIWIDVPNPLAWGPLVAICWIPQALIIWLIYLDVRDWKKRR